MDSQVSGLEHLINGFQSIIRTQASFEDLSDDEQERVAEVLMILGISMEAHVSKEKAKRLMTITAPAMFSAYIMGKKHALNNVGKGKVEWECLSLP